MKCFKHEISSDFNCLKSGISCLFCENLEIKELYFLFLDDLLQCAAIRSLRADFQRDGNNAGRPRLGKEGNRNETGESLLKEKEEKERRKRRLISFFFFSSLCQSSKTIVSLVRDLNWQCKGWW